SSLTYATCHLDPTPMRDLAPALPRVAEAVVMRALTKDPQRRFPTGRHMAEYLRGAALLSLEPPDKETAAPTVVTWKPEATRRRPPRASVPAWAATVAFLLITLAGAMGISVVTRGLAQARPPEIATAPRPLERAASLGAPAPAGPWAAGNEAALIQVELRVVHRIDDGTVTVWS